MFHLRQLAWPFSFVISSISSRYGTLANLWKTIQHPEKKHCLSCSCKARSPDLTQVDFGFFSGREVWIIEREKSAVFYVKFEWKYIWKCDSAMFGFWICQMIYCGWLAVNIVAFIGRALSREVKSSIVAFWFFRNPHSHVQLKNLKKKPNKIHTYLLPSCFNKILQLNFSWKFWELIDDCFFLHNANPF